MAVKEASDDPVVSLNNAMAVDGAVIQIAAKTVVEKPIYLVFVHSGKEATAAYTRSRVVVENGAQVTLVESHEGENGGWLSGQQCARAVRRRPRDRQSRQDQS